MLKLENVSKYYGTQKQSYRGVEKINLTIKEGEAVAIVGTSGTGKSTLLNVMSTIDRPTSGQVWLDDTNLTSAKKRERSKIRLNNFGFVFQKFNLIGGLNVYDNIVMPAVFAKNKVDYEWVDKLIEELGIKDIQRKAPNMISGGEQQRVAIARALVNHPKIIFADEPTGNLDTVNSENVADILFEQGRKNGCSLVIVTHDMDIAKRADRIIRLDDGQIVA